MRGMRKVSKPKGERRFPNREDPTHLAEVRKLRCIIGGKRIKYGSWKGPYPKKWVVEDMQHICCRPIQPHHVDLLSQGGHDHMTVPLCKWAHRELHDDGPAAFEKKWDVSLKVEAVKFFVLLKQDRA